MYNLFKKRFEYYKKLGDDTFAQLSEEQLFWTYNSESNSIATLIKHISGNMESRWTNFLTEDGEKAWRNRDAEFVNDLISKEELVLLWEKGWAVLFDTLGEIEDIDGNKTVLIRGEQLTVDDALLRQLARYAYHIGQIIGIAKMLKNKDWKTLTIAKNESENYSIEFLKKQTSAEIHDNSSPVCFANSDEVRDDYKL